MIVIRTDASSDIGTGHVRRCLSLAHALRVAGVSVLYVCRDSDLRDWLADIVTGQGHELTLLPKVDDRDAWRANQPAPHAAWGVADWQRDVAETCASIADRPMDWLLIDHYAYDARWHNAVRLQLDAKLAVVDDLADRPLSGDVIIDHNWHGDHLAKYQCVLSQPCFILGGPRYALLDPAYADAPRYVFHEAVRSIGVFMGGSDTIDASSAVLEALVATGFVGEVEVVTTSANPNLAQLRARIARRVGWSLSVDLPNLASFYARHDVQVGAGGGATWERFCIGSPVLAIACAENQREVLLQLTELGYQLGVDEVDVDAIASELSRLIGNSGVRRRLHLKSAGLVDGKGAAKVATWLRNARRENDDGCVAQIAL